MSIYGVRAKWCFMPLSTFIQLYHSDMSHIHDFPWFHQYQALKCLTKPTKNAENQKWLETKDSDHKPYTFQLSHSGLHKPNKGLAYLGND